MTRNLRIVVGLIAALGVAFFGYDNIQHGERSNAAGVASTAVATPAASDFADAAETILAAFHDRRSDLWIEAGGRVQQVLSDDSEGSRHQRFIVRLVNGHTVLIAHNIDVAQRVPVRTGDNVSFYGEYEWNDRGGVVHWTHRDTRNRREGGWIRHAGTTYR